MHLCFHFIAELPDWMMQARREFDGELKPEVDVRGRTAKGVVWLHRIVQPGEQTRRASTHPGNGRIQPDFAALIRGPGCKAGTFPRNQSISSVELVAKQKQP